MKLPLTPDLCAAAIVASARTYGDDPAAVLLAKGPTARRAIAPAVRAIVSETGASANKLRILLGCSSSTLSTAARRNSPQFQRAVEAATRAILGLYVPEERLRSGMESVPATSEDIGKCCTSECDVSLLMGYCHRSPRHSLRQDTEKAADPPKRAAANISHTKHAKSSAKPSTVTRQTAAPNFPSLSRHAAQSEHIPVREHDEVSPSDRALIEAAIAAGRVRQVKPDGSTELVYDRDTKLYARKRVGETISRGWRSPRKPATAGAKS